MNHADHVSLLSKGIPHFGGTWADLGAGSGAFTLALAELIGANGTIYAVDQSGSDLQRLKHSLNRQFPRIHLKSIQADFTNDIGLPSLDGIVMANSLHFLAGKHAFLLKMRGWLKDNGRFLLVEYNVDQGNRWVPYPISFSTWRQLAKQVGFQHTELLATRPSRFLGEIYAAASW